VLSLGYVSLHEQRKVTRSVGAKAFEVEVVVAAAAFNSKSNARAAEQAPLYEITATCTNVPGSSIPGHRA
jgi:hypothetical protein